MFLQSTPLEISKIQPKALCGHRLERKATAPSRNRKWPRWWLVVLDYDYVLIVWARVTAAARWEGVEEDIVIRHSASFVVLQCIGKGKGVWNRAYRAGRLGNENRRFEKSSLECGISYAVLPLGFFDKDVA